MRPRSVLVSIIILILLAVSVIYATSNERILSTDVELNGNATQTPASAFANATSSQGISCRMSEPFDASVLTNGRDIHIRDRSAKQDTATGSIRHIVRRDTTMWVWRASQMRGEKYEIPDRSTSTIGTTTKAVSLPELALRSQTAAGRAQFIKKLAYCRSLDVSELLFTPPPMIKFADQGRPNF
jgi:hypothetical protein